MPDIKPASRGHKLNVYLTDDLWEKVVAMGFTSPTEATSKAFEHFTDSEKNAEKWEEKARDCEHVIESLRGELNILQVTITEKNARIDEFKERIEDLKATNKRLTGQFEQSNIRYDNYMAQMQTLIKQKAIETPDNRNDNRPWYRKLLGK